MATTTCLVHDDNYIGEATKIILWQVLVAADFQVGRA